MLYAHIHSSLVRFLFILIKRMRTLIFKFVDNKRGCIGLFLRQCDAICRCYIYKTTTKHEILFM